MSNVRRTVRLDSFFYLLDKKISEDKNLSWAGRGILIFLLGKPDNWQVSVTNLVNETKGAMGRSLGRDGVYGLLTELMSAGYVVREQSRAQDGRVLATEYLVSEVPRVPVSMAASALFPLPESPLPGKPYAANPYTAKTTLTSTDSLTITTKEARTEKKTRAPKPAQAQHPIPDVPAQLLADFLAVRKAKRGGPLTETAINGIQREADAAGLTLVEAITACCEFSWISFDAVWYADRKSGKSKGTGNRVATRRLPPLDNFTAADYVGGDL